MKLPLFNLARLEDIERRFKDVGPVLSLYLSVGPAMDDLRLVPATLKDLVRPVLEGAGDMDRAAAVSLRRDVERIVAAGERLMGSPGRGVAVFACDRSELFEVVVTPAGVKNRAIVEDAPYLRPLYAMLEALYRFAVVALDHRRAEIFRFHVDQLEQWEQMNEEEVRKSNFGGFAGYAEQRTRAHADAVAHRHFREVAARLHELAKGDEFDKLLVGGQREVVDGLIAALHPDVVRLLAGTFAIDLRTMTPAQIAEHCRRLGAEHAAAEQAALVDWLVDTAKAGGNAVLGVDWVVDAINQRAVHRLVIDALATIPGRQCPNCHWLAAGEDGVCPACGEAMVGVTDIVDAAARSVRDAGGSVRHITEPSALSESVLGAVVRFPVAFGA